MERLTYTDEELSEFENMDCPVKANDLVSRFCDRVCDEFQYNCPFMKMAQKLKAYEDKQEQGLLKTFPRGIGADIYSIPSETNFRLNLLHGYEENNRVYHQQVESILIHEHGWYIRGDKGNKYGTGRLFLDRFFKKTWFLTEAEAEEALAKMGGK